jgi:hypothetical protein
MKWAWFASFPSFAWLKIGDCLKATGAWLFLPIASPMPNDANTATSNLIRDLPATCSYSALIGTEAPVPNAERKSADHSALAEITADMTSHVTA